MWLVVVCVCVCVEMRRCEWLLVCVDCVFVGERERLCVMWLRGFLCVLVLRLSSFLCVCGRVGVSGFLLCRCVWVCLRLCVYVVAWVCVFGGA